MSEIPPASPEDKPPEVDTPNSNEQATTNSLLRQLSFIGNSLLARADLLRNLTDPRRDIDDECGRPKLTQAIDPLLYQQLYDRHAIAGRVVELWPEETWKVVPDLSDDEDPEVETEFDLSFQQFGKDLRGETSYLASDEYNHPLWDYLKRLDILSGIGKYGVMLIGLNDGRELREPAAGIEEQHSMPRSSSSNNNAASTTADTAEVPTGPYGLTVNAEALQGRKVTYLRVFPESLALITQYEGNISSPRFGQPVMYQLTFNDPRLSTSSIGMPIATLDVHWTRVIHVPSTLEGSSSEIFGIPRQQQVLDNLLELRKIYGADGEGFWRGAILKLFFSTHPQLGGDAYVDDVKLRNSMEAMMNGLQQWMSMMGMQVTPVAPEVTDPNPHTQCQLEAISIKTGIPKRILMGSERGELSSAQDSDEWAGRVRGRQLGTATNRLIAPTIDRLILLGALAPPQAPGYKPYWPDLKSRTEDEKANNATKFAMALAQYVSSGGESVITVVDFLVLFMGLDEETAQAVYERALDNEEQMTKDIYAPEPAPVVVAPPARGDGNGPAAPAKTAPE